MQAATAFSSLSKRVLVTPPVQSYQVCNASRRSAFQSRTVLSSPPDTMSEEVRGENVAARTQFECPTREATKRRLGSEHNFTILSSDAESTSRSLWEMSQARTGLK